jgi:Mrp family chromosome partitioning ATPase
VTKTPTNHRQGSQNGQTSLKSYPRVAIDEAEGEKSEHRMFAIYIFHFLYLKNVYSDWIVSFHCDKWLGSVRSYAKHLRIDGVKDTIAIASGKGGVGKSTTAGTKLTLQSFCCVYELVEFCWEWIEMIWFELNWIYSEFSCCACE